MVVAVAVRLRVVMIRRMSFQILLLDEQSSDRRPSLLQAASHVGQFRPGRIRKFLEVLGTNEYGSHTLRLGGWYFGQLLNVARSNEQRSYAFLSFFRHGLVDTVPVNCPSLLSFESGEQEGGPFAKILQRSRVRIELSESLFFDDRTPGHSCFQKKSHPLELMTAERKAKWKATFLLPA